MSRFLRSIVMVGLAVLVVALWFHWSDSLRRPQELTWDSFIDRGERAQIKNVIIQGNEIHGQQKGDPPKDYHVLAPFDQKIWMPRLEEWAKRDGVEIKFVNPALSDQWISSIVMVVVLIALFVGLWYFLLRQAQIGGSQAMAFGRSRARRSVDGQPKTTFDDVAGVDEAKEELLEVVEFLRNTKKFQQLQARIPKGVLLLGPPGSGKTLLARAVAGEAGVPFFHISGSEFVEMFVGVGAARVRDLFDQAKANRPCIIFIDEIDAVGRQRFAGLGGGHDEREQTLNQLLVEMDGFDPNAGVVLIAATNRPDVLDPALLRPGRFDRRIIVENPDINGRKAILELHSRGKPMADDIDLHILARRTPGFSGADLANAVNEAALLAARRNRTKITMADMEDAVDRVMAGPERRSRVISDHERKILAHHEVGHALLAELLPHADPLHKISIIPRGMALGYTQMIPVEDRFMMGKEELLDQISALLGGRAAEEIFFTDITTGAANDLERATELARRMVMEFGMSEGLGPVALGKRGMPFLGRDLIEERNFSESVASKIDEEVRKVLDSCYEKARTVLQANRDSVGRVAEVLLERETLDRDEVAALLRGETLPPQVEAMLGDAPQATDAAPADGAKAPEPTVKPTLGTQPAG